MDTSVEAVDGDILLKFKNLLVEDRESDIIANGSPYPGRPGMGIFDNLGCW